MSHLRKTTQLYEQRYGFDKTRLHKRAELIKANIDPYPYSFGETTKISQVVKETLAREAENQPVEAEKIVVAGRLWAYRKMGKVIFADLNDGTGKIQLFFRQDDLPEKVWVTLLPNLDHGDILGVSGTIFRTKTGELSIKVSEFTILAKTVVPIPIGKETVEKTYNRMANTEIKYRERYLSWMLEDKERNRMVQRSKIISAVRRRMEDQGFLEVSTPTIEFVYGGAEARPFETSIWALDNQNAFLRVSPELYLKRFLVGGFDKVFTICQNFRNEGIDHSHNPEFSMIEWYESYSDYNDQMVRFEELVAGVCQDIHGTSKIEYQGTELDFTPPWPRITVVEALKKYAGLDVDNMTIEELKSIMAQNGVVCKDDLTWGHAIIELFEELCEKSLIQPIFITDHPIEISPLTKKKRGDDRLVERFEPYAFGMEIGNAYSELTDPVDQLQRLMAQRDSEADYEDHPVDADFVKAIGCGMPPTGGVGLGIDRLIMLLTNSARIRDIIPFPMYKPKP